MQSDQIDAIAAALAKAQGAIKNPIKNCTVNVRTKSGHEYQFKYADLTAVVDAIKKPLSDNGIFYTQYVEFMDGRYGLTTKLIHASGQYIGATNPLFVNEQASQAFGSAVTFMKRYALCGMLGISADADDDANAAEGNQVKVQNGGKRENPHVTKAADIIEHEPQYDDNGDPVDNIPHGNPELEPLNKARANTEYKNLMADIRNAKTLAELKAWANLKNTQDRVQTLPHEYRELLRWREYRGRQIELGWKGESDGTSANHPH